MLQGVLPDAPDDQQVETLLRDHVTVGATVADIGAHAGRYVTLMAELVGPAGRVIAVEPNPAVFGDLQANTESLANVTLHQVAALDVDGTVGLWLNPENAGDSRVYGPGEPDVRVQARRLAGLVPRLDFALLDTQGTEHLALKGLGDRRPPVAVVELWDEGLDAQGSSERKVLAEYAALGYRVVELERPCPGYRNILLHRI